MKLNKIIKWCMVALLVIGTAITVWGFAAGFETDDAKIVDVLFYWAYAMIGLAIASWVVVGGIISAKANPKSLVKLGIVLVGVVILCLAVYFLSPADYAYGREGMDTLSTLKLTDTTLNLAYISGVAAIIAVIVGEVRMGIKNRK